MVVQVSDMRPSLLDQLWTAIWSWLERHDSLAASIVGGILTGGMALLGWRAKRYRDRERELEAVAREHEERIEAWRKTVDGEIIGLKDRMGAAESSVRHVTAQLGEVISRITRVDHRQAEAEERSREADARIEARIERTVDSIADVQRGVQAILIRNQRVDHEAATREGDD